MSNTRYKARYQRPLKPKAKPVYKGITFNNQTELNYAMYLDLLQRGGEIESWMYEPCTWRLTTNNKLTKYTPDFRVVCADHVEYHEVKGFLEDDANVKFKVAASMYPEYRWLMVTYKKKQWHIMKDI